MDQPGEGARNTRAQNQRIEKWRIVLKRGGFRPRTVVDVGVGRGTPELYEAFPEAVQILIEPLKEHESHLRDILKEYKGQYFLTAVGARKQQAVMNVAPNNMYMSSILERTHLPPTEFQTEERQIQVTTLDSLMGEHGFEPPFGLKIDAEGFEYQIMRGARAFLRETQFVIAEVSVTERFKESYMLSEFTELMDRNGFFLWDVLRIPNHRRYVDAVFRRSVCQSQLRQKLQAQQSQLQQIRSSKTWKLLKRVNRARTKVLRRKA